MWSREIIPSGLLIASLFVASSNASPTFKRLEEITCESVNVANLRDAGESKEIWDRTTAGVLADEFINEHGLEHWVQDLDQKIFGKEVSNSWDCFDWGTQCELVKECSAYENNEYLGGYFLYYSLQQLRAFLNSMHERLQDNIIKNILDVDIIQGDFEKHDDGDVNPWAIVAGGLGAVGAVGGPAAPVAGIMAGVAGVIGETTNSGEEETDGGPELATRVKSVFEQIRSQIDNISGAVFGKTGYGQDLIPVEAQRQSFGNAAVNVLGDGQWLVANPTDGLAEAMDDFYHRTKQALAWAMMRVARKTIVFIDAPVKEHECGSRYSSGIWDPELGHCFRLFNQDGHGNLGPVGDSLANKLWDEDGDYRLDKLETYRNAYDCWVENDGKIGVPTPNPDGGLPKCHFGMVVVKGTYDKTEVGGAIWMSEWLNQKKDGRWEITY